MKVLLLNGSPNQHGCTHTALCEVARAIEESGIETEILWIGNQAVRGCIGCGGCARAANAAASSATISSIPRWIKCALATGWSSVRPCITRRRRQHHLFPGSHVLRGRQPDARQSRRSRLRARRAGTTATLDQLSKYFTICGMPLRPASIGRWCMAARRRMCVRMKKACRSCACWGATMAYMIRAFALARENGLLPPDMEKPKMRTNFIR